MRYATVCIAELRQNHQQPVKSVDQLESNLCLDMLGSCCNLACLAIHAAIHIHLLCMTMHSMRADWRVMHATVHFLSCCALQAN